jgi:hypothetical protein
MRRILVPCALIAAAALASANAQGVRTEAPCSPVIDRTQGNVTVNFTGGCTAGMTPTELQQIIDAVLNTRAVALESFEELAQRFGVTSMAVTTFFRILGETRVPVEDLDAKLREIAPAPDAAQANRICARRGPTARCSEEKRGCRDW